MGEAAEIARAIHNVIAKASTAPRPIRIGEEEAGQLFVFHKQADGRQWSPLGVTHVGLAAAANALTEGTVLFDDLDEPLCVPMTTLERLFEVGPTHDLIGHMPERDPRGAFEFNKLTGPTDVWGKDRALWAANSKTQKQLVVHPTHKGSAPTGVGSESKRAAMRQHQSMLFYARNMRWTSQAILAASTRQSVHGGRAWTSLGHKDKRILKAFALWANSTVGMIVHWTQGQRTQLGRAPTQIGALREIPCPRLDLLTETRLNAAARVFDELASKTLRPTCQAHADTIRHGIDAAVIAMLALSDDAAKTVEILRWLWCNEPSVHGRNKIALSLLQKPTRP